MWLLELSQKTKRQSNVTCKLLHLDSCRRWNTPRLGYDSTMAAKDRFLLHTIIQSYMLISSGLCFVEWLQCMLQIKFLFHTYGLSFECYKVLRNQKHWMGSPTLPTFPPNGLQTLETSFLIKFWYSTKDLFLIWFFLPQFGP